MHHRHLIRHGALAVLAFTLPFGCADVSEPETTARSGLLFDLSDEDVEQIHGTYLADEDLEATRARLTAPFDCSLYGDFCAQVGAAAAEEITAAQIDLALEGAPLEEIETQTRQWIDAAAEAYSPEEGEVSTFRAAGAWTTQTIGNYRMRVRNGVTSPVLGQREAWTEAEVQHQDFLGAWWKKKATEICVNAGTNTQTLHGYGGGVPDSYNTFESFNPSESCSANVSSLQITTYHTRNNGYENSGLGIAYEIEANGCATAEINSSNFSRCASSFMNSF